MIMRASGSSCTQFAPTSAGFSALNTISYDPSGAKVNWLSLMSASTRPLNPPSTASECTVNEMYASSPRTPNTRYERSPRIWAKW